jgi:hypothetical protein
VCAGVVHRELEADDHNAEAKESIKLRFYAVFGLTAQMHYPLYLNHNEN